MKKEKFFRQAFKRIVAFVLAIAFIMSGMNVTSWNVKAEDTTVVYDLLGGKALTESGTVAKDEWGDDIFCEHQFNDLDATMLSNLGTYSSLIFEASVKVNSTTGQIPTVVGYSMDANYKGWKDDGAEVTALGTEVKVAIDLTSYKTMSRVGVRFTQCDIGTVIGYTITSAKITAVKSSDSPGDNTTVPVEGLSAKVTKLSGNSDWAEFNYSITNANSTAVKGLKVVIPFSGTVNDFQSFGGCTASKVGNTIVIKHTKEIAANSTYSCTSNDKFGFAGGASLGTPVVSALTEEDNASQLKYPLTGTTQDVAYSDTPVGKHGALHLQEVSGYSAPVIVDESGNPFQLRGASTHGVQWFPEYINKGAFQSLRDEWGVNMIRLACYVTQYNGYTNGGKATIDNKIVEGVQAAKDLGMYIIVDWHIHEENPHTTKAQALEFFKNYATMYKDYDNVIFEICNEPTSTNWYNNGAGGDLYSYCKEVATVIRDCGSKALIVCGTNTWSQDVDDVAKKPLKDDGFEDILYTFHFYSGSHYNDKMQKVRTALNAGTPIFVTEFGVCNASGNGGYDTANADAWIKLCDQNNISYACWSLCNKSESASYLLPSCNKTTGGWVEENLSTTGLWLVNTYRAHEEAEKEKENPNAVSKVTLDKTTLSLGKGESATLTATVSPATAENKTVTWSSSDTKVATVVDGKVTAVAAGTATITVKTEDGEKIATCKVTVTAPGITLNKGTLTLKAGDTATLNATVTGVTDETVAWSSSDTKVATVDKTGKVTAVASGTAKITATAGSGANAVTAACTVTVTKNTPKVTVPPSITVEAGSKLSDIKLTKEFKFTADVEGTFAWETEDKTLTINDNNTKALISFTPTDKTKYDSVNSIEITILVTKKQYASVPDAPELSSATANTVTLKKVDQTTAPVQYGLKKGATSYTWQEDNKFTGLSEYSSYEFALRYGETDIYEASEAGETLKVTTTFNDANKHKIDLSKLTEENYVEAHDGTISYDAENKILYLEDEDVYTITGSNTDVKIQQGVTIKLEGAECKSISSENVTIQLENESVVAEGIYAKESITIENGDSMGVGSLTVSSGEEKAAIDAPEITIKGGEINATGTGEQKAIKAINDEKTGVLKLLGGIVTANADIEPPIKADKIVLDGGQVISKATEIYSKTPEDGDGNKIDLCYVTYTNGEKSDKASIKKGSKITLRPLPAKAGYKANGWKLADEVFVPGTTITITQNVTFIADYAKIEGTVKVSVSEEADLIAGYKTDSGVTVTITNDTNVTIDKITLALSNGKEFEISDKNITGLASKKSVDVTVALKNSLGVGEYETNLTVTCVAGECDKITKGITRVVGKASSEKPKKAPEILTVTSNSVTLVPATDKTIEYGIKQADGSYKWQAGNEFTALKSYTTYSFAIRYAETDSTKASEASDSVDATTLMDENGKYIVDLTQLDDEGYVDAHDGSISYNATKKELTLLEEKTYTITGNNPDIKIITKENTILNLENAKLEAIEADKDVDIVLKGTSTIKSTDDGQPAVKAEGSVMISQAAGAVGSVAITGGDNAAGIEANDVTIKSGTVTVTGGKDAAGIVADKVTVSGGTVTITGQGDNPAIKADSIDIPDTVTIKNGSDYKEQGGDTPEKPDDKTTEDPNDKTSEKPNDKTTEKPKDNTEDKDNDTGEKKDVKEDEDDGKKVKPALLCSNILLQKGKSIRLQTNDDDVDITKVAYANNKSKKIVKASSSGKLTGKKTGTASLKVTYEYDDVSYTKTVKVKVQKNQVVSLTKKSISLTLKRNKKANLVNPSNMLSSKGMKFSTSNKRCVKVSSSGVVKARRKGTANVTVKIGKTKYTVKIKVK